MGYRGWGDLAEGVGVGAATYALASKDPEGYVSLQKTGMYIFLFVFLFFILLIVVVIIFGPKTPQPQPSPTPELELEDPEGETKLAHDEMTS